VKKRRYHPSACRVCGVTAAEVGNISALGYCREHGIERALENQEQLRAHAGPLFDHWRARMAASVGAVLPEPE
jgi:hypothetical protein